MENVSPFATRARRALPIALAIAGIGCSSSTDPGHHLPPPLTGHPTGSVATTTSLGGYVHGVAVAHDGTVLVTRTIGMDVVPGRVNPFAFAAPVAVPGVPVDVAIAPDSRTAFIASLSVPTVTILDLGTSTVTGSLSVGSGALRVLATPDGNGVYVTTQGNDAGVRSTVYHFDAHTHALLDTIVVGSMIDGIAYDSAQARLYLASNELDSIYVIDAAQNVVVRRFPVATHPQDLALSLDGTQLWVATESSSGVRVFDVDGNGLFNVPNTSLAFGLARSPDGTQFYVTETGAGRCAIIDAETHAVLKEFHTGSYPRRVAFDTSGSSAVITDEQAGVILVQ